LASSLKITFRDLTARFVIGFQIIASEDTYMGDGRYMAMPFAERG